MPRNKINNQPILQDTEVYTEASLHGLNIPSLKQILLQRAWEQWNIHKNEKYAIFYQTSSFCLLSSTLHQNLDLSSYLDKITSENNYQSIEKSLYNYSNFEDVNKYLEREITSVCHQFPKEWTVIQLCKNFNPIKLSSKYDEIIQYNTGISMTIFKHAAIKDMLMLEVRKQSQLENLFEKTYKIAKKINDNSKYLQPSSTATAAEKQENKEKYWRAAKEVELHIQDTVKLLTSFFGPWKAVLTGNFKSRKSIEVEGKIRKEVQQFLSKRTFTDNQEKLIYLIARRTDLLSQQQIFVALTYILQDKSNLGYNDVELNDLYDHLTWIKQEYTYDDTSTYPCILIIDELLDQMPFEMINTQQEYTRVCSFSGLKQLFERHSQSIDQNGYVMCPVTNCQAIINPDKTLCEMEDRMRNFFSYWLPAWKVSYGQLPSKEVFHDVLSQSDVFAYCGHGSGFVYSFNENIYDLKTNGVVFLFGCGSTGLTSSGLNSELKGPHIYYHLGNSPTVVGFLWTVTDFQTDICSTKILSSWMKASSSKPHWQLIDKTLWKKNGNLAFTKTVEIISSDSLTEVIAKIHSDSELPFSIRASLVYRGLPVMASNNTVQNSIKY